MKSLELLAPAKNLECGIAAIDHGADAVYIGAGKFGARAAAGNSVEDIGELCRYAHRFGAHVHVTVNTIVYEHELEDTMALIKQLDEVGVDALLLQDMGVLSRVVTEMPNRHFQLHASTQCDSRSIEKVKWLHSQGFQRVVLARELSAEEIARIHAALPEIELEAFVHGALCVSYSGVCYASQYCFHRSANRGECAQFCRMKFDLSDSDDHVIERQRYLLSLKDMNRIDNLKELVDAGACSFKIEGRLKDVAYVKNVVSAYSQRLDKIVAENPKDYCRASCGQVEYHFEPNLQKTFNRGFTSYFLHGRQPDIASFDTPKAMGEYVGTVKEIRGNSFNVAGTATFANGDGLCFINAEHELEGFRVNKAVGNRLFPMRMPEHLKPGTGLYRNNDEAFEKLMAGKTAERKIDLTMAYGLTDNGFWLAAGKHKATVVFEHQPAQKPQTENINRQLTKLGNTSYRCERIEIVDEADKYFIPSSLLADLRRELIEQLQIDVERTGVAVALTDKNGVKPNLTWQPEYSKYPYLYNIANESAVKFYEQENLKDVAPAYEVDGNVANHLVMQCRHCIRYSLGFCVKRGGRKPTWREPLFLTLGDGRRFRLEFKCDECQMNIYVAK